jgi:glucokinase
VSSPVLAIDFGGTKVATALVDADGTVVRRDQMPTAPTASGTGDELYAGIEAMVEKLLDGLTPIGIGIGCGGPMDWALGRVSPLNVPAWRDYPLRQRLLDRFPSAVVRLHNDAIAMAVGEHWRGAGRGSSAFLGVVISTGVGGGIVIDGRILGGGSGNAGHIGHVVVDPSGPDCACGGRGCLEAIARGPAVVAWAVSQGWQPLDGAATDGRSLLASAQAGDATALAAFTRAGTALGVALASTTYLLELDRVAIGGGLANAEDLLLEPARAAFDRHRGMAYTKKCELVRASLGGDAGLVGAAALIHRGNQYWPAGVN